MTPLESLTRLIVACRTFMWLLIVQRRELRAYRLWEFDQFLKRAYPVDRLLTCIPRLRFP